MGGGKTEKWLAELGVKRRLCAFCGKEPPSRTVAATASLCKQQPARNRATDSETTAAECRHKGRGKHNHSATAPQRRATPQPAAGPPPCRQAAAAAAAAAGTGPHMHSPISWVAYAQVRRRRGVHTGTCSYAPRHGAWGASAPPRPLPAAVGGGYGPMADRSNGPRRRGAPTGCKILGPGEACAMSAQRQLRQVECETLHWPALAGDADSCNSRRRGDTGPKPSRRLWADLERTNSMEKK